MQLSSGMHISLHASFHLMLQEIIINPCMEQHLHFVDSFCDDI